MVNSNEIFISIRQLMYLSTGISVQGGPKTAPFGERVSELAVKASRLHASGQAVEFYAICAVIKTEAIALLEIQNAVIRPYAKAILREIAVIEEFERDKMKNEKIGNAAAVDREMHKLNGVSLNPYSTFGSRHLWQQGWDDVRPANMLDGSGVWAMWERGRQARALDNKDVSVVLDSQTTSAHVDPSSAGLSQAELYDVLQNDLLVAPIQRTILPASMSDHFREWLDDSYDPIEREAKMAPENQIETEVEFLNDSIDSDDEDLAKSAKHLLEHAHDGQSESPKNDLNIERPRSQI